MVDLKRLFSRPKPVVGLDIGSGSLKLVEIQETAKGPVLSHFSQMPQDRGVIVDGNLVAPEALTANIKTLFKDFKGRRKGVVTSLSGDAVIVKKVTMANMDEAELRETIHDEAGKYLPFDNMDKVNFDFQILGPNEYNPNQMDVLLVAAKTDIVSRYTQAVEAAGLRVVIMDADAFALETMYEANYDVGEDEVAVMVNIGASITNINVVKGGASIFTRDFLLGGNAVTEAIAARLGLSFADAEKIKVGEPLGRETARLNEVGNLLDYAESLGMEIERSIDYFRFTFGRENIKRVILAGGGARLPGLADSMAQRLGIPAEIAHPFQKIGVPKKVLTAEEAREIGPQAAVAVGLALRKVGDK